MPNQSGWRARHPRMTPKSWTADNLAAKLLAARWTRANITTALDTLTPLKRHDRADLIATLTPISHP